MANIGTFTAEKDGFTGTLRTLTLNVKVKLVPNDKGDTEKGFGEQWNQNQRKPYHLRSVPSSQASASMKQLRMSASWLISVSRSCTVLSSSSSLRYEMANS